MRAGGVGRRGMGAALLLLAPALLLPGRPAGAQERPALMPTRDADVLYDLPGGGPGSGQAGAQGGGLTERLRWSEALRTLRVDPPGDALYMLVDYAAGRMQWVDPARREVMEGPAPDARDAIVGEGDGRYRREGEGAVAGLACTLWRTADARGTPMTLCLTRDGVLLEVSVAGRVALRAREVGFAPVAAAAMRVPEGYARARMPAPVAPGAAAAGGGGGSALSMPMAGAGSGGAGR